MQYNFDTSQGLIFARREIVSDAFFDALLENCNKSRARFPMGRLVNNAFGIFGQEARRFSSLKRTLDYRLLHFGS